MNEQLVAANVRVIIAEDHTPTRDSLAFLLQRHDYDVTVTSDGRTANDILERSNGPTVALLDWMLPEMTGLSICRKWHREHSDRIVYFIIITARDSMQDLAKAFDAGADDFIRKPCDPAELIARIRNGRRIVELEHRLSARVAACEDALNHVSKLRQLLPICMYCKRVRDDSEYWKEIDIYIHEQAGTDFSHGICPECMNVLRAGSDPNVGRWLA